MLGDKDVTVVLAQKDMDVAKKFYGETLGLTPGKSSPDGGMTYKSGGCTVFIYPSSFAGTNQATAAAWSVDNVEEIAEALKAKGVKLEQYDIPGVTREGDVHVMGDIKAIWFKDPSGNILNVESGMK